MRDFGGKGITVKIYPEAKQKARNYKKGNWDKREFLIDSDKYAQVFASTKFNTSGLKLFTLTENYSKDVFYKDEPYSEGNGLTNRERWAKMGVLAEEMEAAALYMNAARAGKKALCICTISNNLVTGESLSSEERQTSFDTMITLALKTAAKL